MAYDVKDRVKDIRRPKKAQHGGITKVYTYRKVSQKRKHVEVTQDGEDHESFTLSRKLTFKLTSSKGNRVSRGLLATPMGHKFGPEHSQKFS